MNSRDRRLTFVDIARGVGALLVVYTHLQAVWLREADPVLSAVSGTLSVGVLDPLQLITDSLGQIAVVIFFLASGYVVTPIALRLGVRRFGVNRFFRVYPLLIVSVALAGICVSLGIEVLSLADPGDVDLGTFLTNILFLNFVLDPQSTLLGVAWTLLVEVLFYFMIILLLPLFRRMTWLAIAIELLAVCITISLHGVLSGYAADFVTSMAVMVFPVIGQMVWAAQQRMISLPLAGSCLLTGWLLFVWAAGVPVSGLDEGYETAAALAVLLFLIGLFAEPRLRPRRIWNFLSDRCYSIYLLHGVVAIAVIEVAFPVVGMLPALVLALVTTAIVVEVMYRYVERPSHELGRRFSRPHPRIPEPAATLKTSTARAAS